MAARRSAHSRGLFSDRYVPDVRSPNENRLPSELVRGDTIGMQTVQTLNLGSADRRAPATSRPDPSQPYLFSSEPSNQC